MRPYFMENNEFEIFKRNFQITTKNASGTIVKNGKDGFFLGAAIQKEISGFHDNRDPIHLCQKAIIIDCEGREPSKEALEESAMTVQSRAPGWGIRIIRRSSQDGAVQIFSEISQQVAMKIARKTRLVHIPILRSAIAGMAAFLISLLLASAISRYFGHGPFSMPTVYYIIIGIASLIGLSTYWVFKMLAFPRSKRFEILTSKLKTKTKEKAYGGFVSAISYRLISQMPLAIIIEDISTLDDISTDVINHISKSNELRCTGALLWIAFRKKRSAGDDALFGDCTFPVRRYSIACT
jgi:hypothetical protein